MNKYLLAIAICLAPIAGIAAVDSTPLLTSGSPYSRLVASSDLIARSARQATTQQAPGIMSFAPGTSVGLDYVIAKGGNSACLSTTLGSLALGKGFAIEGDALAGVNLAHDAFTGGYAIDLCYQFALLTINNRLTFVLKGGGAQLFGAGVSPIPGINLSAAVVISLKG